MPRRAAVSLTAAALAGAAAAPAAGPHAVPRQVGRPRGHAVCAFSAQDFRGLLVHIRQPRLLIDPPIESAVNDSRIAWCFYEHPGYGGPRFVLESGQREDFFPYPVQSVRPAGADG